jgi:hypothetical protein
MPNAKNPKDLFSQFSELSPLDTGSSVVGLRTIKPLQLTRTIIDGRVNSIRATSEYTESLDSEVIPTMVAELPPKVRMDLAGSLADLDVLSSLLKKIFPGNGIRQPARVISYISLKEAVEKSPGLSKTVWKPYLTVLAALLYQNKMIMSFKGVAEIVKYSDIFPSLETLQQCSTRAFLLKELGLIDTRPSNLSKDEKAPISADAVAQELSPIMIRVAQVIRRSTVATEYLSATLDLLRHTLLGEFEKMPLTQQGLVDDLMDNELLVRLALSSTVRSKVQSHEMETAVRFVGNWLTTDPRLKIVPLTTISKALHIYPFVRPGNKELVGGIIIPEFIDPKGYQVIDTFSTLKPYEKILEFPRYGAMLDALDEGNLPVVTAQVIAVHLGRAVMIQSAIAPVISLVTDVNVLHSAACARSKVYLTQDPESKKYVIVYSISTEHALNTGRTLTKEVLTADPASALLLSTVDAEWASEKLPAHPAAIRDAESGALLRNVRSVSNSLGDKLVLPIGFKGGTTGEVDRSLLSALTLEVEDTLRVVTTPAVTARDTAALRALALCASILDYAADGEPGKDAAMHQLQIAVGSGLVAIAGSSIGESMLRELAMDVATRYGMGSTPRSVFRDINLRMQLRLHTAMLILMTLRGVDTELLKTTFTTLTSADLAIHIEMQKGMSDV